MTILFTQFKNMINTFIYQKYNYQVIIRYEIHLYNLQLDKRFLRI